jgi:hypothetical protein
MIPVEHQKQMVTQKAELLNSLLAFTQTFYFLRTGRQFKLSHPASRESHYISICRDLTEVVNGNKPLEIINIPPRYGKAIDVETPILTKYGWTIAGDIKVGDEIIGSSGWTKVTGVYPQGLLPAKQITFSDNQTVICNHSHLWNVCDRYTPKYKTLSTFQIEDTLHESDGRLHWRIPMIDGEYGELAPFIDPYLFGCWLGDGNSYYAGITTMDEEIVEAFRSDGNTLIPFTHQSSGKATSYGISKNGFCKCLRENGLLKNKHIPQEVYRWSKQDRLALLQGLMDTDGTCGKNGQVSFTNTNEDLIKGCGYLVNSLGGTYRIYQRRSGVKTLNIRLPDEIDPFRLQRKSQYVSHGARCAPRRFVESIIDTDPVEMVCFTVAAEDKLFAIGDGLILTHNTEIMIHLVAWCLAKFPDCNFLYVSYSHSLAAKQTQTIREIISMPHYKKLFGVELSESSSAKDNFETTAGGSVYAAGTGGTITGRGAGVKGITDRFSGAFIIDDAHKPDEALSDVIREGVIEWFHNTAGSRFNNGERTPLIFVGQRVHEEDLAAHLSKQPNAHKLVIKALDDVNNPLDPALHDLGALKRMQEQSPYVFAAQYQQDPQPAGGGIFKPEWFKLTDETPKILATFITADTAETDKTYNDASVFSFWGLYKVTQGYEETDLYALHWIDCREIRVEPKDLQNEFLSFYSGCMRFPVKPLYIAIEKKSTGVTLSSVVGEMQGLTVLDIERSKQSMSKCDRFISIQPYVAKKLISLTRLDNHTNMCLEHCRKITANNSHAHDDIADTLYDAVKLALIDKVIVAVNSANLKQESQMIANLANYHKNLGAMRRKALW